MQIIRSILEMQRISLSHRCKGQNIALVPTMGYLHKGHLSLVKKAKEIADISIVSIFVNPTQFAPNEDFNQYPRDFERDFDLCKQENVDYIFLPDTLDMYPKGYATSINIGNVTEKFEGIFRPTHFQGVATVVAKLFNSTLPHFAIFGQKDYQQTLVIKRLNEDLNFGINIIISPTMRENTGLAMSSRNSYLSDENKAKAGVLSFALEEARKLILSGETDRKIINSALQVALKTIPEIKIDYAAIALTNDLGEPEIFFPGDEIVILLAVYIGKTRLIDNMLMRIPNKLNDDNFIKS